MRRKTFCYFKKTILTVCTAFAMIAVLGLSGTTASAATISLANGSPAEVTEVDGLETTITGRVIVANQAVNVGSLNGSVYCVAQPGIRVYEYMTVNYGGTTYSLIQYGTSGYAFTASSAWYVEGTAPASNNTQAATDSDAEWIAQVAAEMTTRAYMAGRMRIPSAGIDVAYFTQGGNQSTNLSWRQSMVDAKDSAGFWGSMMHGDTYEAYSMSEYEWIMGDHCNQDFSKLTSVQVGDYAYLNNGSTITTYQCVRVCAGTNSNGRLCDSDGTYVGYLNAGGFVTYTCKSVSDSTHVNMCFWQPV